MVKSELDTRGEQVDSDDDNNGVDGTESIRTSTPSDSTLQPIYENGRRYCNEIYFMPNDEPEQTRLSIVHQAFLILLDGELTKAPLPPEGPGRVLDVGTGPGDWAVEMGQRYPNTEIIATDISVFDGGPAIISLPNVHFQLDDAEDEWTYHKPFNYIHFRGMSGAFRDWRGVYEQAFKHLQPGGYIEIVESDPAADNLRFAVPNPDSYYNIFVSAMRNAADSLGYPRGREHLERSLLTSIGFVDVNVQDVIVPVGVWPRDFRQSTLGKMVLIACLEGLEARSLRSLTATGKWKVDEVRDLCEKVKQELMTSEGLTISVRFVTARKPENS
ncbi:conserved hypothetical protein [Talaromyces stipitatus ATCC 10500]|uniref:S-adenosyl-L-methionine-dependent methyltransferase n=1 Tax=Talaromyces stipitatus (strain ATCC 10500 / CBS 375.48 / QM 6759 / NRRL 1006) TaxID=441959 RepID=B8MDM7_TALSN|nr:uncharacterized protein TSTA_120100 [Talaromyces stipitatus ATCC 10500]EED18256.1 conserved hypothetical protein [Talaromyces stipitatus ATCC 10500]